MPHASHRPIISGVKPQIRCVSSYWIAVDSNRGQKIEFHNGNVFAENRRVARRSPQMVYSTPLQRSDVVDVESFVQDDWLKFGLRISLLEKPHPENEPVLSMSRVELEVLDDDRISEYVRTKRSVDIFAIQRKCSYLCPPDKPLNDVKEMVRLLLFATESRKIMNDCRLRDIPTRSHQLIPTRSHQLIPTRSHHLIPTRSHLS